MFSNEIADYLRERNYSLNHSEYFYMYESSPQINHIIYRPFENCLEMWDDDGTYFRFTVHE